MASGKTTLGREMASERGLLFLDLDACIEEREGCSIPEIFTTKGETYFRELEKNVLHHLCESLDDFILAAGGGTPCFFDNMAYMNSMGHTLFLKTSFPVLIERLKMQRVCRPLLAAYSDEELEDFVAKHLKSRLCFYDQAKEWVIHR